MGKYLGYGGEREVVACDYKQVIISRMYDVSRSAVLLEGEKSASFSVEQGVAQVCSCRGRQRKMWGKRVDTIFEALLLDKEELLDGIKKGNSLSKSFLECVDECVSERESKAFGKGLDIKTKLHMYKLV